MFHAFNHALRHHHRHRSRGGTLAYKLAPSGKKVLLLERGGYLPREKNNWNSRTVFIENKYKAKETWRDKHGNTFHPGIHYNVGGNSKVYGAALLRMRHQDFGEMKHHGGISPEWPIRYEDLEPYYTQGHGFPARAIVPGHCGMKSVQWLTEIEVVALDYKGYYAQKGWTDEALIKTTSRIDLPGHGTTIRGLNLTIEGLAFAGIRGIKQVEISTDGGERWMPAILAPPLSSASWVFWHYDWIVPKAGRYTLIVRATDGTGTVQTSTEHEPAPDGASGLHEITVTVEP